MLKHMTPGPASTQTRLMTRGGFHRTIQPLNVTTTSHQSAGPQTNGPTKLITNGIPHRMSATFNYTPVISTPSSANNKNFRYHHGDHTISSNPGHSDSLTSNKKQRLEAREALTSLGLLCLISLLLALLSLIFLLKISPGGRVPPPPFPGPISIEDYVIVYDVTLALCTLSLSLNLCCLLVCAIQFLFAVKLIRTTSVTGRSNKYLEKSSISRVCAVGGFFVSIPIFLTGIILYTFTQFHSTPAIITSTLIGVGIVFCGGAMVHNVFVWQKEKTICARKNNPVNQLNLSIQSMLHPLGQQMQSTHPPLGPLPPLPQPPLPPVPQPISVTSSPISHYVNHIGTVSTTGTANQLHLSSTTNTNTPPTHHASQLSHHTTPVTPITPLALNHSHMSLNNNQIYVPSYGLRTASITPPTPKIQQNPAANNNNSIIHNISGGNCCEVSRSVSPGMPTSQLELSNITTNSLHELSTLV